MPRGVYKRTKSKGLKAKAKAKKAKRPRWRVDVAAEPFQVTDEVVQDNTQAEVTQEAAGVLDWLNAAPTPAERQLRKQAIHGASYCRGAGSLLAAAEKIHAERAEDAARKEQLAKEGIETVKWGANAGCQQSNISKSEFNPDAFLNVESRLNTNPKTLTGQQKVPVLSVVPPASIIAQATAMRYGAFFAPRVDGKRGYGPYNWRDQPIEAHIYVDAAIRHLMQWWDGDDNEVVYDDEGNVVDSVPHLAFALATIGILIDARANATLIDDRPKKRSMAASAMLKDHKLTRSKK